MIGINISMPTKCCECQFNDGDDLCYIDGIYSITDFTTKPSWCPLINLDEEIQKKEG